MCQHIEAETKWPPFSRRHFQTHFLSLKCINSINISLKFVPRSLINNIPLLVQIMACRRPSDKPLSEPMMVKFAYAYMRHSISMSWIGYIQAKTSWNFDLQWLIVLGLSLRQITMNNIRFKIWMNSYIHIKLWSVINEPCHTLNGDLA